MTKSTRSDELRMQLKSLDTSLVPGSARGSKRSTVLKATTGDDRVHGETN